jgi:methyl-accepting chemotaxis protein
MDKQMFIREKLIAGYCAATVALILTGGIGSAGSPWLTWIIVLAGMAGCAAGIFVTLRTVGHLRRITADVGRRLDEVANASLQVASSSTSLAQGASEQAASLEETSATSNEISSTAARNAENSRGAAVFMQEVLEAVGKANGTLEEMVNSIIEINIASEKISKIMRVIDEIAFHTNILALNAAVEAARAGDAGMGFAVVADEVRNLAQKCGQAARDTSELIEESIRKAGEGTAKMEAVTIAIGAIGDSAVKAKALVDEVNAVSGQQANAIGQIAKAIGEMESVTQRTAAAAEEGASVGTELRDHVNLIRSALGRLTSLAGLAGA